MTKRYVDEFLNDLDYENERGFRGNANLKKRNVNHRWTRNQIEELDKCSRDVLYFINNYCKVVTLDKGVAPFHLYDYQKKFVRLLDKKRWVIARFSRQSGKSVCVAAYLLYYTLFNDHKTVAILANKADSAREIMGRLQKMYEELPVWLQQGVVDWNKGSVTFENYSKIISAPTSSSAIRGKSISILYLDEYAFVPRNIADEFMTSVYPTISSGKDSKIFITSTPYGLNHFYKIWTDAVEKRNGYTPIAADWRVVPGRDEKWKEETLKNIGEEAFLQEYEIEFLGSAGTLIDPKILKSMTYQNPIYENDRGIKIYKEPAKNHIYITTVDCSEGIGKDYAVVNIMDVTKIPYEQVAIYRSNTIDPHLLPEIIIKMSSKYNNAYTLCELNSTGIIVTSILWNELEFEYMLWCSTAPGLNGQQVLGAYGGRSQMGIKTSSATKRTGCSVLKTLIESGQLIINDYTTLQELYAFARKGNSYAAQEGNHDDTIATLFIFSWMTKQTEFSNILENASRDPDDFNIRKRLPHGMVDEAENTMDPIPIIDDGLDDIDPLERSKKFHNPDRNMLFF